MRDCDLKFKNDAGNEFSATDYLHESVLVVSNTSGTPLSTRDRTVNSILTIFPKIEWLQISNPGSGISNPSKRLYIDPDFFS